VYGFFAAVCKLATCGTGTAMFAQVAVLQKMTWMPATA
jgi:hypothetical protein